MPHGSLKPCTSVPLCLEVEVLKAHKACQLEERTAACSWEDEARVFPNTRGKVRRRDFVVCSLRRLLRDAGLPAEVRFHDLRHKAATLAVKQGMPIHVVSRMLCHSDPAMTLRRYAHVFDDMRGDAARPMEDLFCPPPVSQPTPTSANLARHDGFLEGVNCRYFSARSNISRLPERPRPP